MRRPTTDTANVNIICDADGKKLVLINDIRFKGKKREEWEEIKKYLIEYIGKYYEIQESSEKSILIKIFLMNMQVQKVE